MRHIASLQDESEARLFGDCLVARGIPNEVEVDPDRTWSVWIRDDDHVPAAQELLAKFRVDPKAREFDRVADEAAKVRKTEAEELAEYRRRIRTRRSLFPKFGGYGVGILTYALIVVCVAVAIFSRLGAEEGILSHLFISDPASAVNGRVLPEVFAGEVWRLLTPIFIHFGPLHLIFNLLWLYQLGCMIEARQSSGHLAALVAVTGLLSNLAQYLITGVMTFGGMSGVVYGLGGYVWIRGKYDGTSGLFLDPQSVTILLVWLVVCYSGIIGPIANTAHLAGLIVGMGWGGISAYFALRK